MAFDKVFSGDPSLQDVAAPGSHQNPSFGVDVVNKDLYISAGDGWEPITGSGGAAGSTLELQYNNSGSVAGAAGGTTNGTHFALGAGSTIDNAPATIDGAPFATKVVADISESYNGADLENGLYTELHLNPSAAATNGAYGLGASVTGSGSNWGGSIGITGMSTGATYDGTGVGADAMSVVVGAGGWSFNSSSGEVAIAYGATYTVNNGGTGLIAQAIGVDTDNVNSSPAGITSMIGVQSSYATSDGTTGEWDGINIPAPSVTGPATITLSRGILIGEQGGSGIGTAYQIDSEGTSPSLFKGPIELPYTKAQIVYSAAGTALPSAATAGIGARAFVSDATANVYGTAYSSGGSIKAPVYSDGSAWNMG